MVEVACVCEDWKPNQKIIDRALTMEWIHGRKEGVKIFRYCPYCGKELKEIT